MRDQVVQVARDPQPFLHRSASHLFCSHRLQQSGLVAYQALSPGPQLDRQAEQAWAGGEQNREDRVGDTAGFGIEQGP